jgi:phage tail sheath protein FI
MPEYLSPGVYVEEVSAGPKPIEGVSTSTAGFVGQTERGPTEPRLVTSWIDYTNWFGGYRVPANTYLPFAVKGFFDNGGQRAFVARVAADAAPLISNNIGGIQIQAAGKGVWGTRIFVRIRPAKSGTNGRFRLSVIYYSKLPANADDLVDPLNPDDLTAAGRVEPDKVEDYDDIGIDPDSPEYFKTVVNTASQLIRILNEDELEEVPGDVDFSDGRLGTSPQDDPQAEDSDYLGVDENNQPATDPNERTGLAGLALIDGVALLSIPDEAVRRDLRGPVINQCELLRDRFAIICEERNASDVNQLTLNNDSTYAATYHPWVRISNPLTRDTMVVPPAGHVAGIYARTDIERGVHKAPANAVVRGIVTRDLDGGKKPLQFTLGKGEHDILNPRGINVIRDFRSDGRGIRVWGARTISSDPEWRYINVRRLFIFVEESIEEGTQWVVFEPNYEETWDRVRRSVTNFLIRVWRSGALAGTTQDEAFFVKCDRTTMTQAEIDAGQLICLVGLAPVKPAEFVIFRISQKTLDAQA